MTSLWRIGHQPVVSDELEDGGAVQDVVVGAGLTGMVTALLLARAGREVVVLEARDLGAVTTGHTTAKLSLLQGTKYSEIVGSHPDEVVRAYVQANHEGREWLLQYCEERDVAVQRRSAVTFAPDEGAGLQHARAEHEAALRAGLDVRWVEDLAVPFPHAGGTVLDDQAQLDPMELLVALAADLRAHGGRLVTGARVTTAPGSRGQTVRLTDGRTLGCEHLVLATGTPVLDRGLHFARVSPQRSYSLAFEHPTPPELMLLSAHGPSRSIRDAPGATSPLLLVGGEGHVVGRTSSEAEHEERLRSWTHEYFPDAVEVARWSAQDYSSHDGLPIVGSVPGASGHVHVATGFDKWGMTNAVAASLTIAARVLGGHLPWAGTLWDRPVRGKAVMGLADINTRVVASAIGHGLTAVVRPVPEGPPEEGSGVVGREGLAAVATSTVDGRTCSVSGLCTHLGGVLEWNDAERSWDCPLHGSRFAPDGTVLEGPATRPLSPAADRSGAPSNE